MKMQDKEKESRSFRNSALWEYIQVIVVAFVLVFGFMRPFVVEAFKIPSRSMKDTLLIGDRILVAKFMYGITVPFVKIPRFSMDLEHQQELNRADWRNNPISEKLWREFDSEGLSLSRDAFASIQRAHEYRTRNGRLGTEWLVSDRENTYTIIGKMNRLEAYSNKIRRFSIGLGYGHDLDIADWYDKPVSERLWEKFNSEGFPLSKDAVVSIQQAHRIETLKQWLGTEWLVTDGENSYTIIKKKDKLKIYSKIRILDFHKPKIGNVFVFRPPPESERTQSFIKRIVGLPGDVIMVRDGDLYRNGEKLTGEDYAKRILSSPYSLRTYGPETVPPGHVFAMGDNRDLSNDSRKWGFVPIENIKGQAFLKYFSWNSEGDFLHKIRFSRLGRRIN